MTNQQEQSNIILSSQVLKKTSRKKCVMVSVLFGFLLPAIILEILEFSHDFEYFTKLIFLGIIITPLLVCILNVMMYRWYRCPKCYQSWCYQRNNEIMLDSYVQNKDNENIFNYIKSIQYLAEYICNRCMYKKVIPKRRKFIEWS